MAASKENIKKKFFIKLYSESDSRLVVPGSERALELIQNFRRDEIKKVYIIASSNSISLPYINLFQMQAHGVTIRDLVLEKVERQDIYAIKSIIDDINASIKIDQSCEIILFNGSLAGIILACFYVNAGKDTALSIKQVKKIMPNVFLSGSDISFINEFGDFVREARTVAPGFRPEPDRRPPESTAAPAVSERKVQKREGGEVRDIDAVRRLVDQAEPAGILTRFRIATKLVALVALVLVFSLSLMIFLGTSFFRRSTEFRIHDSNAVIARLVAGRMQDEIASSLRDARAAATISSAGQPSGTSRKGVKEMPLGDAHNFIFMGIAGKERDELKFKKTYYNEEYINSTQVSREILKEVHRKNAEYFAQSFDGKIVVRNVSPDAGAPVLGMSIPYRRKGGSVVSVIVCYVPLDRFIEVSRLTGPARTYMVNEKGDCVVDADSNRVVSRISMADVPIVRKMLLSTSNNGAMRYRDIDGSYHLGSYTKIGLYGLGVVVSADEGPVLHDVYDIQRRNFIILGIVLIAAVLGAFIFSKTISAPIDALRQIAVAAPPGVLKLAAPEEGDEIFYLTQSFRDVLRSYLDSREGLAEEPVAARGPAGAGGMAAEPGVAVPEPARDTKTQQFRTEGLKIQVTYDGPEVSMAWMGKGNLANPGELLNPYLEGIINSMRGRELTCDFSSLEMMNASIIQSIIKFAHIVDENRIRARFIYNKSIDWQDAAFEALSAVVGEMDTISLDGRMLEKNMFILQ